MTTAKTSDYHFQGRFVSVRISEADTSLNAIAEEAEQAIKGMMDWFASRIPQEKREALRSSLPSMMAQQQAVMQHQLFGGDKKPS